jgi:hypothetical protein
MLAQDVQHGPYPGRAGRCLGGETALESGLRRAPVELPFGCGDDGAGDLVEGIEAILASPLREVTLAQEVAILAHEQGKVRLLADEVAVVVAALEQDLRHGQCQGGVSAGTHGNEEIGVHRRGRIVRGDGDDLAPVVTSLVDEVRVGNLCVGGIGAPDQYQVRAEEVVGRAGCDGCAEGHGGPPLAIVEFGVRVEFDPVEHLDEPLDRHAPRGRGEAPARFEHHTVGLPAHHRIDQCVGDLHQRLVPAHAFEAPGAPLTHATQGVAQTARRVHQGRVAGALLAAARIEVGDVGTDLRIVAGLLLAQQRADPSGSAGGRGPANSDSPDPTGRRGPPRLRPHSVAGLRERGRRSRLLPSSAAPGASCRASSDDSSLPSCPASSPSHCDRRRRTSPRRRECWTPPEPTTRPASACSGTPGATFQQE